MSVSSRSKASHRRIGRGSAAILGLLAATVLAASGCGADRGQMQPPPAPGFFGTPGSMISPLLGLVLVLAIVAAIAYAVVLLVRNRGMQSRQATNATAKPSAGTPDAGEWNRQSRAQQILDERFASGELNIDEYNRRLSVLRQSRTP